MRLAFPVAALLAASYFLSPPGWSMEVSEVTVDFPLAPVLNLPAAASARASTTGLPLAAGGEASRSASVKEWPRAGWEKDWFAYRQDQLRGNARGAEERLDRVLQFRRERGIPDLYQPAAALLYEAGQAMGQKRFDDAMRLIEFARRLAPDDPAPHFLRAQAIFRDNRLHILSSLEAYLDGWAVRARDFRTLFPWLLNLAVWLATALLAASVIFIISLAARVFPLLAHELSHLLANLVWPWYLFPPLSLAVFMVTGLGLLWWLFLLALIMYFHLAPRERIALAVACLLLGSISLLVQALSFGESFFQGSRPRLLYEAERGGDGVGALPSLRLLLGDPSDTRAQAVASLLYRREGRLTPAEEALGRAAKAAPDSVQVMNNMGNLALASGRVEEAIRQYQAALRASDDGRVHFNLSQAYRLNLSLDEGAREFAIAQVKAPEAVNEFSSTGEGGRRLTADIVGAAGGYLADSLRIDSAGFRFREAMWKGILPGVSFGQAPFVFAGVALLVLAGWSLSRSHDTSSRCPKCGRLFCPRCARPNKEGLCSQCNQIFVVRTGVDPAQRVRKMMQIMNFQKRRSLSARLGTIILPGLGHSGLGAPLTALFFLAVSSGFWSAWVMWGGLFRSVTALETGEGAAGRVVFFLLFGLFYIIALRQAGRHLEEE